MPCPLPAQPCTSPPLLLCPCFGLLRPVLSCPFPCPLLRWTALPCLALPLTALPCPALPCPALPCCAVPSPLLKLSQCWYRWHDRLTAARGGQHCSHAMAVTRALLPPHCCSHQQVHCPHTRGAPGVAGQLQCIPRCVPNVATSFHCAHALLKFVPLCPRDFSEPQKAAPLASTGVYHLLLLFWFVQPWEVT